ncbi:MAG: V-type ATP synthase subunit E [Candidatus Hodarchaeota archaeon]
MKKNSASSTNPKQKIVDDAEERAKEISTNLRQKIIGDAEETAKGIVKEVKKERQRLIKEDQEAFQEVMAKRLKQAEEEATLLRQQQLAEGKVYAKRRILTTKEELLESAFEEAKKKLAKLTKEAKYGKTIESLILNAAINLNGGKLEVAFTSEGAEGGVDLKKIADEVTKKTKKTTTITASKRKVSATGGVVLRTADGKIEVDNTFDTLLNRFKRELRPTIAGILFQSIDKEVES